jgi:hypothetical protein
MAYIHARDRSKFITVLLEERAVISERHMSYVTKVAYQKSNFSNLLAARHFTSVSHLVLSRNSPENKKKPRVILAVGIT